MVVKAITSYDGFKQIINTRKPILIDFWAEWCGPCRLISPVLEQLSENPEGVEFYKVNVDEQQDISLEVSIRAIPTFMLFKDGNKVADIVGASSSALSDLVNKAKALTKSTSCSASLPSQVDSGNDVY